MTATPDSVANSPSINLVGPVVLASMCVLAVATRMFLELASEGVRSGLHRFSRLAYTRRCMAALKLRAFPLLCTPGARHD
jgi:hypothetical protein